MCAASRVGLSAGQMFHTGGAIRPNEARGVRCPRCGRVFDRLRIAHTDHGIPTPPQAVIPNHKERA